jgi:hypothetical protein
MEISDEKLAQKEARAAAKKVEKEAKKAKAADKAKKLQAEQAARQGNTSKKAQEKAAKQAKNEQEAADVAAQVAAAEATPAGNRKDVSQEPPNSYHPKYVNLVLETVKPACMVMDEGSWSAAPVLREHHHHQKMHRIYKVIDSSSFCPVLSLKSRFDRPGQLCHHARSQMLSKPHSYFGRPSHTRTTIPFVLTVTRSAVVCSHRSRS